MHTFRTTQIVTRTLGASAFAATLILSATASASSVQRIGNNYSPTGSDFSISALQGIDSSNMLGTSGAQVNLNFEMNPSIGVTYSSGNGQLTDFGLGLYTAGGTTKGKKGSGTGTVESTGLSIQYNSLVNANTATLTVEDFDLKSGATGFNSNKVEPSMLIFGANNTLLAKASASDVFSAMTAQQGQEDVWDINIGKVLSNMHATGAVSKVVLYADASNGEKTNSDPYLLRSVGKAQAVPEPCTFLVFGAGALLLRRRKKQS